MTKANSSVSVGAVRFDNSAPLAIIAGPCALESREHAFDMAGALKDIWANYRSNTEAAESLKQSTRRATTRPTAPA